MNGLVNKTFLRVCKYYFVGVEKAGYINASHDNYENGNKCGHYLFRDMLSSEKHNARNRHNKHRGMVVECATEISLEK